MMLMHLAFGYSRPCKALGAQETQVALCQVKLLPSGFPCLWREACPKLQRALTWGLRQGVWVLLLEGTAARVGRVLLSGASTPSQVYFCAFGARLSVVFVFNYCLVLTSLPNHLYVMKASAAGPDLLCLQEIWGAGSPHLPPAEC